MKQCPTCRTTYTDETLRYCLADGGVLVEAGIEAETIARQGVRIDVQPPSYPTIPVAGARRSTNGSQVIKIVAAVLILGFLGLLGLGAAGALFYFNSGGTTVAVASPTPIPSPTPARSPSPSPTPDDEQQLEEEMAKLKKQLEDALNPSPTKTPPGFSSDDPPTARVNSPADGFLALRSEPDTETGERLAQIPHGAVVALENCEKEKVKIGSRTGRWCMVTYRGQTGWVFDAWLQY
ncbi:MAG: SH3 domain-containing protein [bacterium]|nr:SH3 domain-containing protein [bacterium]